MDPFLFVRADHGETFGVAPEAFAGIDRPFEVWNAIGGQPAPDLDGIAAVVVFGSAFNTEHADEQPFLYAVRDLIRATLDRDLPYLGICFGAQALAWALDMPVRRAPVREIGFVPIRSTDATDDDPLLGSWVDGDRAFQWHMDTFDLPPGAVSLATGDDVHNQAFRLGSRAWATQFHFEVDRAEIGAWIDATGARFEDDWGRSPEDVRTEAAALGPSHEERGRELFRRFARIAQTEAA